MTLSAGMEAMNSFRITTHIFMDRLLALLGAHRGVTSFAC
jgi:hypothetical protein